MPQQMRADRGAGRVAMSCKVNDIEFSWQLAENGDGTGITVRVVIAAASAHQLDRTRELLAASLPRLAALAEAAARGGIPRALTPCGGGSAGRPLSQLRGIARPPHLPALRLGERVCCR